MARSHVISGESLELGIRQRTEVAPPVHDAGHARATGVEKETDARGTEVMHQMTIP